VTNKPIIEGIKIISKYVKDDDYDFHPGHDQIWFGAYDIVTDIKDILKLRKLGWFEDEESWSAFV